MKNLLQFQNVKFFYQTKESEINALENISFSIDEKEFSSIVGPSGCGKTTILSLTAGLLTPSEGKIILNGQPVTKNDSRIGYMFQRDQLFEWRTIWQNIILGLELQKKHKDPEKRLSYPVRPIRSVIITDKGLRAARDPQHRRCDQQHITLHNGSRCNKRISVLSAAIVLEHRI